MTYQQALDGYIDTYLAYRSSNGRNEYYAKRLIEIQEKLQEAVDRLNELDKEKK